MLMAAVLGPLRLDAAYCIVSCQKSTLAFFEFRLPLPLHEEKGVVHAHERTREHGIQDVLENVVGACNRQVGYTGHQTLPR